jgi:hypothetical protein
MAVTSVYALQSFAWMAGGTGVVMLLSLAGLLVMLACMGRCNNRAAAVGIAGFAASTQVAMTVLLALLSGYGFLPPWTSFLVASVAWLPVIGFGMVMTGSSWRTAFLITTAARKGWSEQRSSRDEHVPRCSALISLGRAMALVVMRNPLVFWVASVFAFVFVLAVVIALAGVCYCTNPTELTTWASRRTDAKFCLPDSMCHVYAMLGPDPTRLRIVAHIVVTGDAPGRAWVAVCAADASLECTGAEWGVQSTVLDHAHLEEDKRYVSHTLLAGLNGSTLYRIQAQFVLADAARVETRTIVVRTPPAVDSNETVVLIGGGDYHSSAVGIGMLRAGLLTAPDAQAIYFGGDLSYANNLRTCYLRWDRFLHAVSSLVNVYRHNLPLLTIPGNHEAGGYLVEANRADYYFYTAYFPQYDDDAPRDPTITYHSHVLGPQLGIVALDSGTMVAVQDQVPYLERRLRALRGVDAAATPTATQVAAMRFMVVMYHNAAYGSTVDPPDAPVVPLRQLVLPMLDRYKVPMALEFHEHTYKRTYPMADFATRPSGEGVTYVGDGALGVQHDSRELGNFAYVRVASQSNYINAIRVYANGTCVVTATDDRGFGYEVLDQFSLTKRW